MAATWPLVADELAPYLVPKSETLWFNPVSYGAVWNSDTPVDNTAAIQEAIDEAQEAAGTGTSGRKAGIILPPGETWANGLTISSENIDIWSMGCWLRSYEAQGAPEYLLSYLGEYGEAGHIFYHSITGVSFDGRGHANVRGLYLKGCSHFHMDRFSLRSFNGSGAGHALTLDESYDCSFARGLIAYSGRNASTPALATSLEAVQLISSEVDNCNQIVFDNITFEQNIGIDVASRRAPGSTFANAAIKFRNCKWEQGGSQTVFAGVYAPESVTGAWSFEGAGQTNGYHRDGAWMDMAIGTGCQLTISEQWEFGYKTDQAHGVNTRPTIVLSGNGGASLGGRITSIRAANVTFLDIQGITDPVAIEVSNVSCAIDQKAGWGLVAAGGVAARCDVDQGRLRYAFKLAANEAAVFVPRGKSGTMQVSTWDVPTACGSAGFRVARVTGDPEGVTSASIAAIGTAPAALEFATGTLTTGDTTPTAEKIHVRLDTLGRVHVQNRFTGATRRVFISFDPARTY